MGTPSVMNREDKGFALDCAQIKNQWAYYDNYDYAGVILCRTSFTIALLKNRDCV